VSDEHLDLRLTPLDPRRPAPDMLEDLLTGIEGCFLLWQESAAVDTCSWTKKTRKGRTSC
jgi:hypothetical protein